MVSHPLDNPIWQSLAHRHRDIALGDGGVLRYPADIAPFLGLESPRNAPAAAIAALLAPGETLYLLGEEPAPPPGARVEALGRLAQMVCPRRLDEEPGPDLLELDARHLDDVLALTALVYPHYFRPRTVALGRYFGLYEHGRLAAMIGERMGPPGWREISAVCTHPEHTGRGHARRLLAWLSNDLFSQGLQPFLHVSPANGRALQLYRAMGYETRVDIAFWSLAR